MSGEKYLEWRIVNMNSERVTEELIDRGISRQPLNPFWWCMGTANRVEPDAMRCNACYSAMLAILQFRSATDKVLRTAFAEAASMLNSRPLIHVHTDPAEPEPLTPNHFILGGAHPHRVLNCKEAFDSKPK